MSRLVSLVVASARDQHPEFDAQRHPSGPVYRRLAETCSRLQGRLLALGPEFSGIENTVTVDLPLDDFEAGIDLQDDDGNGVRLVTEIAALDPVTSNPRRTYPVDFIAESTRHSYNSPRASAWLRGTTLYLNGPASRWLNLGAVTVRLIRPFGDATATGLQAPRAVLPLPDEAAGAVADDLAYFLARRAGLDGDWKQAAIESEERFIGEIVTKLNATGFTTVDVYIPGTMS